MRGPLVSLFVVASVPATAVADPVAVEEAAVSPVRDGFVGGFSLGMSALAADCHDCISGGSTVGLEGGVMVSRRFGLLLAGSVTRVADTDVELLHQQVHALAKVWLAPRFHLGGGLGAGRWSGQAVADYPDSSKDELGPSWLLQVGGDVYSASRVGAELALRVSQSRFVRSEGSGDHPFGIGQVTVGLGLTWH